MLEFVENVGERAQLEEHVNVELVQLRLVSDHYEEAEPLIRRLRENAETMRGQEGPSSSAKKKVVRFSREVQALSFIVRFQARRGDLVKAMKEMEVKTSHPTPYALHPNVNVCHCFILFVADSCNTRSSCTSSPHLNPTAISRGDSVWHSRDLSRRPRFLAGV